MQVFGGGNPISDEKFYSRAIDAFREGAQELASNPDADEVRVRKVRAAPKKRGAGVTRKRPGMSRAKRKAQKKARKAQRR